MRMWRLCINCQTKFGCRTADPVNPETRTCWRPMPEYFATHD